MEIIFLLLIGIGLSMDAFSLALCYGVLDLAEKKMRVLSITVGIFHFFMPLLGMVLGNVLKTFIILDMRIIVYLIFMVLGLEMIIGSIKKEMNIILLNFVGLLLFAFTVSIDSFSAGVGINFISNNYILCSIIFSLMSCGFTYAGLKLGSLIGTKFKGTSTLIGGSILVIFALVYLFRYWQYSCKRSEISCSTFD